MVADSRLHGNDNGEWEWRIAAEVKDGAGVAAS